jgi:antitoxin (DNA-binding transcriptional repressor) of toxin-antitoxin stability system
LKAPPPHEEGQFVIEAAEARGEIKDNRSSHPCRSPTITANGIFFPGNVAGNPLHYAIGNIDHVDQLWYYRLTSLTIEEEEMIVNISEAKANLSKLVNMVYHGEKVVIAKNNLPLVDLVIHKPEGKRKLGLLVGKMEVPKDIMKEDSDINEMFYGSERNKL